MNVGSVVYGDSGGSGVIMESTVKRDGFVSVLWESSDRVMETPLSQLTLGGESSQIASGTGTSNSNSFLRLKEKMQILANIGGPEQNEEQMKQLNCLPDMLEHMDAEQVRGLESMIDEALHKLGGGGGGGDALTLASSSTSSPFSSSVDTLRAKLALLGEDDPRMLQMATDDALDRMTSDQIASVEAMVDMSLEGNVTQVEISTDFPESSILKYFGTRPDGRFAR
jgi:hypothetical protein